MATVFLLSLPGSDLTFTYDADRLRLSKSMAGGLTTTYQYVNGQLLGEEHSDGTALRFTYDPFGALSGIQYKSANGSTTDYYVRCTLNGDVDQIYDTSGNLLARYIYDSWGRTVSILNGSGQEILTGDHIAVVNPIRYRGYYYDGESGLYYLQSRYYDAKTGRYVNPDGYVYTGQDMQSGNMYAYCGNNPIINIDPTGSMYVRGARDVVGVDTQEFTPALKNGLSKSSGVVGISVSFSATYTERSETLLPAISPVQVTTGAYSKASAEIPNQKNLLEAFVDYEIVSSLKTSAGLRAEIADFSSEFAISWEEIAIKNSYMSGNTINSLSLGITGTLNPYVTLETTHSAGGILTTSYTTVELNNWIVLAGLVFVGTGYPLPVF